MSATVLSLNNIEVIYDRVALAIKGASLDVPPGGMVALLVRGMTLNVSSAVGFITLFGVAVQNGVILVSGLNELRKAGVPLQEAIARGATARLRAVLLTATVAALGMLPAVRALIDFLARKFAELPDE